MEQMSVRLSSDLAIEYHESDDVVGTLTHYPHTHNFCELYFFVSGNCSYMVENTVFKLRPGTVVFTRPGELHSAKIDEACKYSRYFYQFRENIFDLFTKSHLRCFFDRPFGTKNSLVLPISVADECFSRVKKNYEMFKANSPNFVPIAVADFLYTLSVVNDAFDKMNDPEQPEKTNPLVSSALLYINSHLSEVESTEDVAKALFVSREYLSRCFSKEMGLTLNRYIVKKKIANAKQLMSIGTSATDAAFKSGFNNYSYFIQLFRRETGYTPGEWKKLDESKVTILI